MISTKALHKAYKKYHSAIGDLEQKLTKYIDFEFSIFYQESDGFVIFAENPDYQKADYNAVLNGCIKIINEKGKLTFEDYLTQTI